MTKKYSYFILKMLTAIFHICQLNDDQKVVDVNIFPIYSFSVTVNINIDNEWWDRRPK